MLLLALAAAHVHAAPGWSPGPAAPGAPSPRFMTALAYDAGRHRLVLFGGEDNNLLDDTWEFDGTTWVRGPKSPPALVARREHAMAYQDRLGVVVLFGGFNDGLFDDTWEYDGVRWSAGPAAPPGLSRRHQHGMTSDTARGVVVLFGGSDGYGPRADVWEYDVSGWRPGAAAPPALSPRRRHGMTYDRGRSRVVVFGGLGALSRCYGDVWEYDGISWIPGAAPPSAVGPRFAASMAYDVRRQRVLLFGGGLPSEPPFADVWEYDGVNWMTGAPPPQGFEERRYPAFAHMDRKGRSVLFGGDAYDGPQDTLAEHWEYDGSRWQRTGFGLTARDEHAFVTEVGRGTTFLFGGADGSYRTMDAWRLDGLSWWNLGDAPAAVGPRSNQGAAYDAARARVVLVGGEVEAGVADDTWYVDPEGWGAGPVFGARKDTAMAFHMDRQVIVLFGGSGGRSDTWELDESRWTMGPPAPLGLTPRRGHAMAWCASARRIALFGGWEGLPRGRLADTWFYDSGWKAGPPAPQGLAPRLDHAMASDPARGTVLLFGGDGDLGPLGDTWELDGIAWTPGGAAPAGLGPRTDPGLAYSEPLGGIVLHGGRLSPDRLGDVWTYTCAAVSPASLPGASIGVPYAQSLTASGGSPPYTFTVTRGILPPGLSLSPSGLLSGTPERVGTFAFLAKVSDPSGCAGSTAYRIAVGPATDFLVGQGLGPPNPDRVRVFDASGAPTAVDILAFGAGRWGANVAAGNLDASTHDEILAGPGPGDVYGPLVRAFRRDATPIAKVSFWAYATLRYGVNVASGSIDTDGFDEILTGPGPGEPFGPHVRGFDVDAGPVAAIPAVNFYAYATLRYGANVAAGSVDADSPAEILTGPGPGPTFGPVARGFDYDGASLSAIAKIGFAAFPTPAYGVNLAAGDVDGDAFAEMAFAPGPGSGASFPSRFVGYGYDGTAVAALPGFDTTRLATTYGGRVGIGDVHPEGSEELLTGGGGDPAADAGVESYRYDGTLRWLPVPFTPFGGGYGVNVAAGALGY